MLLLRKQIQEPGQRLPVVRRPQRSIGRRMRQHLQEIVGGEVFPGASRTGQPGRFPEHQRRDRVGGGAQRSEAQGRRGRQAAPPQAGQEISGRAERTGPAETVDQGGRASEPFQDPTGGTPSFGDRQVLAPRDERPRQRQGRQARAAAGLDHEGVADGGLDGTAGEQHRARHDAEAAGDPALAVFIDQRRQRLVTPRIAPQDLAQVLRRRLRPAGRPPREDASVQLQHLLAVPLGHGPDPLAGARVAGRLVRVVPSQHLRNDSPLHGHRLTRRIPTATPRWSKASPARGTPRPPPPGRPGRGLRDRRGSAGRGTRRRPARRAGSALR